MGSLIQLGNHAQFRNGSAFAQLFPLLLNQLSISSAFALSLRRVNANYSGSAIRVRRSSDNSETNIGFINNLLDVNGLLSFAGSGSAFVTTWYDQSGNNRNAIQTDSTRQPRIVNEGVLETMNGRPQMFFDGSNDRFEIINLSGVYVNAFYHSNVVRLNNYSTGNNDVISAFGNTLRFAFATVGIISFNNTISYFNSLGSIGPHVLGGYVYTVSEGGIVGIRQNGLNNGNQIVTSVTTLNNIGTLYIASNGIAHANSNHQELISFNQPLNTSNQNILETNQNNYWLSPGLITQNDQQITFNNQILQLI